MNIIEIDFEEVARLNEELTMDEQIDLIEEVMVKVMKNVTTVARAIAQQQQVRNEMNKNIGELKHYTKCMVVDVKKQRGTHLKKIQSKMIKHVLKTRYLPDEFVMKKDVNKLRELTKNLRTVYII